MDDQWIELSVAFRAMLSIASRNGNGPDIRCFCQKCGRGLDGDYQYNFTDVEAHRNCVDSDGRLAVKVVIMGAMWPVSFEKLT